MEKILLYPPVSANVSVGNDCSQYGREVCQHAGAMVDGRSTVRAEVEPVGQVQHQDSCNVKRDSLLPYPRYTVHVLI